MKSLIHTLIVMSSSINFGHKRRLSCNSQLKLKNRKQWRWMCSKFKES